MYDRMNAMTPKKGRHDSLTSGARGATRIVVVVSILLSCCISSLSAFVSQSKTARHPTPARNSRSYLSGRPRCGSGIAAESTCRNSCLFDSPSRSSKRQPFGRSPIFNGNVRAEKSFLRSSISPSDDYLGKASVNNSRSDGGGNDGNKNDGAASFVQPTWQDIFEIPIKVPTLAAWKSIPRSKRIAIVTRPSVLHLTLLSSLGPLIFRGALQAGKGQAASASLAGTTAALTPWTAIAWTVCAVSWHAAHNMVNDLQDLKDDDAHQESFRSAYGVHALKSKYLTVKQFLPVLLGVFFPGITLSLAFLGTPIGPVFKWGLIALMLYTPIFKHLAMGEVLVYFVWGYMMAGYGWMAASLTATPQPAIPPGPFSPVVALFGSLAASVIFGKHTDKIDKSDARTLPKLLGKKLARLTCALTIIGPHFILLWALCVGRIIQTSAAPVVPLGAAAAFLSFPIEGMMALKALRNDAPSTRPDPPRKIRGLLYLYDECRTWPLWFVAMLGFHAVTFGYMLLLGAGMEWIVKATLSRLGLFSF